MKMEYNKENDLCYFLALLDDINVWNILLEFELSDIILITKKIETSDFSDLENMEVQERLLVIFNEMMMAYGYNDYTDIYYKIQNTIDTTLRAEKRDYVKKALFLLRKKFDQKSYRDQIYKRYGEEELSLDEKLRKELYDNAINLAKEEPKKVSDLLKLVLKYGNFDDIMIPNLWIL